MVNRPVTAAHRWNPAGIAAFVIGGVAALSGAFIPALATLYAFAWFIGVGVGAAVYLVASPLLLSR